MQVPFTVCKCTCVISTFCSSSYMWDLQPLLITMKEHGRSWYRCSVSTLGNYTNYGISITDSTCVAQYFIVNNYGISVTNAKCRPNKVL